MNLQSWTLPLLAALAGALTGCGGSGVAAPAAAPVAAPIPVRAQPIERLAVPVARSAPAQVLARNEAALAAEVAGVVERVHADVGERVEAGAPLIGLDARDFGLALAQADAQLAAAAARVALARARRERADDLRQRQFISPDGWIEVETTLRVAEADHAVAAAARDQAERNLAKATLRAPYAAIVRRRHAQVGQMAGPGTVLVELVEADAIELSVQLGSGDADSLAAAGGARFETQGGSYEATVLRISPVLERGARVREARLVFTAGAPPIGAEGRIIWQDGEPALPPDLLVRRDGRLGVFAAEDGRARFIALDAAEEGRAVRVALPPGTLLVDEGQQRLADGSAIELRR